jgi:hypothetical protein
MPTTSANVHLKSSTQYRARSGTIFAARLICYHDDSVTPKANGEPAFLKEWKMSDPVFSATATL